MVVDISNPAEQTFLVRILYHLGICVPIHQDISVEAEDVRGDQMLVEEDHYCCCWAVAVHCCCHWP